MCVCRHSHVWHRQYAHHICSSMYVQTATIKNTTLRNILLHSWSKYFFWCVMQIVDCGDAHMQRLFVIHTCFQDMQPVQGRAFHGRCSIGPGTNMYTHRSARHRWTTWSDDIFMWYRLTTAQRFARGGRQGQAVSNSDLHTCSFNTSWWWLLCDFSSTIQRYVSGVGWGPHSLCKLNAGYDAAFVHTLNPSFYIPCCVFD